MNIQSISNFGRSGKKVQDNRNWTKQKIKNCEFHRLRKRVNLTFSALKIKIETIRHVFYGNRKQVLLTLTVNFFFQKKLKYQFVFWKLLKREFLVIRIFAKLVVCHYYLCGKATSFVMFSTGQSKMILMLPSTALSSFSKWAAAGISFSVNFIFSRNS